MKEFISYLWQLPQNILGLLVIFFSRAKYNVDCYVTDMFFGVSLGKYIILYKSYSENNLKHEQWHQIQSKRLGWLYLIIVGIPSITMNVWDRLFHQSWSFKDREDWYYGSFPEKQADKLGGVVR